MGKCKETKSNSKNDEANLHRFISAGNKNKLNQKCRYDCTAKGGSNYVNMLEEEEEDKHHYRCNCTTNNVLNNVRSKEIKSVEAVNKKGVNEGRTNEITTNTTKHHNHKGRRELQQRH